MATRRGADHGEAFGASIKDAIHRRTLRRKINFKATTHKLPIIERAQNIWYPGLCNIKGKRMAGILASACVNSSYQPPSCAPKTVSASALFAVGTDEGQLYFSMKFCWIKVILCDSHILEYSVDKRYSAETYLME